MEHGPKNMDSRKKMLESFPILTSYIHLCGRNHTNQFSQAHRPVQSRIKSHRFPSFSITSQRSSKTQKPRYSLSFKMPHLSYLLLACLGLAAAAPRGTVQERQQGVHCRTEYITVWDTEYEERETEECVTKWVPECKTVTERKCEPTTRNVVS